MAHLLAIAWFAVLALGAMNEGGGFGVETVQPIGMLIDEGIVLRDELPSDFGRNDIVMQSGRGGFRARVRHD